MAPALQGTREGLCAAAQGGGDVTRPGMNLVLSALGQASDSGASMRSSSAIVVAQLRIVIDL